MPKSPVSVIILTFNEEVNLSAALDSVKDWARNVFVVDSYSTDRTVDIALERSGEGVRVVQHTFENYSKQWNWALENLPLTDGWTLKLDADERITEEFKEEAERLLPTLDAKVVGVYFRRKIRFMGSWLNWGLVRNNYDLRMWRTGHAAFEDRPVNEHALVNGDTVKMSAFVNHEDFKGLADWVEKQNRYISLEVICQIEGKLTGEITPRLLGRPDERRMWLRRIYFSLPFRPALFFLYVYVLRMGFLDGPAGFNYALLQSVNLHLLDLRIVESRHSSRLPTVAWPERGEGHPMIPARSSGSSQ